MRKIYTRKKYRVKGGERPGRGTGIGRDLRKAAVEREEAIKRRERLSVINEEGSERQSRATSQLPLTYMHPTRPSYMQLTRPSYMHPTRQPRGTRQPTLTGRKGRTGRTRETIILPDKECSICFRIMKNEINIITLECNHSFHKGCICNWKKGGNYTCPLCRSDNLHYIKCKKRR